MHNLFHLRIGKPEIKMNTNIKMFLSLAQCSGILHVNLTHYGRSSNLLFYVVSATLIYGIGKKISHMAYLYA